ncbi:MAG: hypothetical protein K6T71_05140 [Candidatus Bipolaricaulota bacterium]|nr:hypothetical protein [Candidatus Bipolaricaulota bacterium]
MNVVRYFLLMRSADSHVNFDLDVARQQSKDNPVYYVMYAYTRIKSIFDQAPPGQASLDVHLRQPSAGEGEQSRRSLARRSLVYRKEEIYWGEALEHAPEILVVPPDGVMAVGTTEFLSNRVITPTYAGSGWHRMEGIFIAKGKAVPPGLKKKLRIIDLFPTIVALLNLPIPKELDGRLPEDLLPKELSIQTQGESLPMRKPFEKSPTGRWEKEIRERLKGLGYV